MKKAIKLVWMVLFALPMVSLTACGDDDENSAPFKEYDYLLGKTINQAVNDLPFEVSAQDVEGVFYVGINYQGVADLYVANSFGDKDDKGATIVYNEVVYVMENLMENVNYVDVANYLEDKNGKSIEINIAEPGEAPELVKRWDKGGKYIFLYNDEDKSVAYANKKYYDSKGVDSDVTIARLIKAAKDKMDARVK